MLCHFSIPHWSPQQTDHTRIKTHASREATGSRRYCTFDLNLLPGSGARESSSSSHAARGDDARWTWTDGRAEGGEKEGCYLGFGLSRGTQEEGEVANGEIVILLVPCITSGLEEKAFSV